MSVDLSNIDLSGLADTLSNGFSDLMNILTDPAGAATAATTATTASTTTATTTGTSAITGTGLSLFIKSTPLALITAHPVLILAALSGGLGLIGAIDVISDFRDGRRNNLSAQKSQPEQVQKA
jgi:hypothetical protein